LAEQRMDRLFLIMAIALASMSCVPVDWKQDKRLALAMVRMMAGGLVLLSAYMIYRGLRHR
jgi:hypothetical protein